MMNENKVFNIVMVVALLALLGLNGFLIYQSFATVYPHSLYSQGSDKLSSNHESQRLIYVSGIGESAGTPDLAVIYVGVKTEGESAKSVQQENADIMNNIIESLTEKKISESDIETTNYVLEPITTYPERGEAPQIVGYLCRNTIAVSVYEISQTGEIIDVTVAAGANEINSIQFRLSEDVANELYKEALERALDDASEKADVVSASLDIKIIGPFSVNVGSGYQPTPMMFESDIKTGTPIMPGELKIRVTVQVSYLYQ
jgi:uncharacterized protein YggE